MGRYKKQMKLQSSDRGSWQSAADFYLFIYILLAEIRISFGETKSDFGEFESSLSLASLH